MVRLSRVHLGNGFAWSFLWCLLVQAAVVAGNAPRWHVSKSEIVVGEGILLRGIATAPKTGGMRIDVLVDGRAIADREGFLRSARSLIQTCGRAARNLNGRVILYGDAVTDSMQETLTETERRRRIQAEYNRKNHITPRSIEKAIGSSCFKGLNLAFQPKSVAEP